MADNEFEFKDPQGLIVQYLASELPYEYRGKVFSVIPLEKPYTFVTVERTGGARDRHVDYATFAVQAWHSTGVKAAADLAFQVAALLENLPYTPRARDFVSDVEVDSIYSFPDPDGRYPRYQLTVKTTSFAQEPPPPPVEEWDYL